MSRKRDRAVAIFFAVIFIISVCTVAVAVIVQMVQDSKQSDKTAQSQEAQMNDPNKLQGTKLANFTPLNTPVDKLQVIDVKPGTGPTVEKGATITFHYTGALAADATIFQSSRDSPGQPVEFPLSDLIPGWQEGIPGMKVGGIRRLIIPYQQGYGEQGSPQGGIPPKADLVFDIEVTNTKK